MNSIQDTRADVRQRIVCPCGFETFQDIGCPFCGADVAFVHEHGERVVEL